MAVQRFVVTATTTVPAGTAATPVPGEPGTGGAAGFGSAATPLPAATFVAGQAIVLDPAGPLYAAIGSANLRPFVDGQDTRGGAGLSNLGGPRVPSCAGGDLRRPGAHDRARNAGDLRGLGVLGALVTDPELVSAGQGRLSRQHAPHDTFLRGGSRLSASRCSLSGERRAQRPVCAINPVGSPGWFLLRTSRGPLPQEFPEYGGSERCC